MASGQPPTFADVERLNALEVPCTESEPEMHPTDSAADSGAEEVVPMCIWWGVLKFMTVHWHRQESMERLIHALSAVWAIPCCYIYLTTAAHDELGMGCVREEDTPMSLRFPAGGALQIHHMPHLANASNISQYPILPTAIAWRILRRHSLQLHSNHGFTGERGGLLTNDQLALHILNAKKENILLLRELNSSPVHSTVDPKLLSSSKRKRTSRKKRNKVPKVSPKRTKTPVKGSKSKGKSKFPKKKKNPHVKDLKFRSMEVIKTSGCSSTTT